MSDMKGKQMKPKAAKKKAAVPNIFLATPMYGGQCMGHYAQSVFGLITAAQARGWGLNFSFMFNESLINRARNGLAHMFLKSNCTHLLFIDADIGFNPDQVLDMLVVDKDVICGVYPKKEINWHSVAEAVKKGVPHDKLKNYSGAFVINLIDGAPSITIAQNQPFEILAGGTGCMLIKREVFEKMKDTTPQYTNDVTDLSNNITGDRIYNFFDVPICPDSGRLLSEDYSFCIKYRALGGQVWAAPWVTLAHVGSYVFEGAAIPS